MTLPTHVEEAHALIPHNAAWFFFVFFFILQDAKRTKTDPNNREAVEMNLKPSGWDSKIQAN